MHSHLCRFASSMLFAVAIVAGLSLYSPAYGGDEGNACGYFTDASTNNVKTCKAQGNPCTSPKTCGEYTETINNLPVTLCGCH